MRGIGSKALPACLLVLAVTFSFTLPAHADDATIARPLVIQKVSEHQMVQLPDAEIPQMKTAVDQGQVSSSMPIQRMQLLLKRSPEAQQALDTVLNSIHTPGSSMYHQTLTPEDYSETFGLAASDLAAVQAWLESHGLQVISVDNGKLAITFKGTAGQVEEAFHTEIHNYMTPDRQLYFANANAVQIPAALASVITGVSGLQNFSVMHEANYQGVVSDPKAANVKALPAVPTIVGRERPVESEVTEEGVFPSSGNILTYIHDGSEGTPDAGITTSTAVTLNPNTVAYGSVTNVAIQATLTWSGSGTPTGSMTFYDTENYLYEQILLTSCALNSSSGTSTYTCTFDWNGAGAVAASPDTITAGYLGDTTYSASSGTASLIVTYPHKTGQYTNTFSTFNDAPGDQNYGVSTAQTISVSTIGFFVSEPPTGNILVTGNGGINEIGNITPLKNVFCVYIICYTSTSISWNPYAYLQPGIYTLTATYSGDNNYAANNATTTFTVNGTGSQANTTVVSANPNVVTAAAPGTTFTTVTTWTGGGNAPTGQVNISGPNGTGLGSAVYPITGATTSAGGGTYDGGAYSYSFNCIANYTTLKITCTIVDSNVYTPLPNIGNNTVTATYGGNSVYAQSSGTTIVIKSQNKTSSLTVAGNPTQGIYGEGTSVTYTASVTGSANLAAPTGSVSFSGTTITGSPLSGTLGNCTFLNHTYTCTASVTAIIPYLTPPNAGYAVTATYLGDSVYGGASNTTSEAVVKQTPTLTAPTLTPNTEAQGSVGPVIMSTTLTWLGSGAAPTGGITFLVGTTVVGNGVCSGSGDTQTCTFSYNPSALTTGGYAVTAKYAGDGNYNAVTSGSSTLTINTSTVTPTLTLTSSAYGSTTAGVSAGTQITLTATLTVTTNNGAWGGLVTFVDATTGTTIGTGTVTGGTSTMGTATISITPTASTSAKYPAGLNQFTATYAGNAGYAAAGPANAPPVYLAGVLYSLTLSHNFSVNPGTFDGSQVGNCAGGVTTTTCTEPYSIQVYNFTTTAQPLALAFINAPSGAFGHNGSCGTSLAAGATCNYSFYYLPPQGDGCVLNATTCTQGTYESGSWTAVTGSSTLTGVGQPGFGGTSPRSGATTFPSTLAGKALLPTGSLSVSPLSYTFPAIASGTTSNTLTIIVYNSNTTPVPFTYTGPAAPFTATNTCNSPLQGGASCNIYVTLESGTPNTYTSTVVLTPANAPTITSNLSGTVQTNNGLSLNTDYHSFGNVNLNTTSSFGLSVTNNSGATQPVGVAYNSAASYTVVNNCAATLAAGQTCQVVVNFTPTSAGQTYTDSVTISSSVPIVPGGTGSGSSYSSVVSFTGTGAGSGQFTATSVKHNFGSISVGTSGGNYGVQLSNNTASTVTFTLGPLANTTEGFSLVETSCGTSLPVNGNCELIFSFTPNATGPVSTSYPIVSSSPLYSGGAVVSPSQITLSGTGQ